MEQTIQVDRMEALIGLFGSFDKNIQLIEDTYKVHVISRSDELKISGEPEQVAMACRAVQSLLGLLAKGETLDDQQVNLVLQMVEEGTEQQLSGLGKGVVCVTAKGAPIKAKTPGQQHYVDAIAKNTVTMGIGPAGTGKTYLAVAMAVTAFRDRAVSRIILTRPAVEAGEKLGFLPGDLQNKVDPYLRPLYDAMFDMLGGENYQKHLERGAIEVAPLAYMRGRTLDDAFIILDEAQNTSREQMKMFLTRMGQNSKIVVTGDVTQIDLPSDKQSGLIDAVDVLAGVEGIGICQLSHKDVVRHVMVQRIIKAYEAHKPKAAPKKPAVRKRPSQRG